MTIHTFGDSHSSIEPLWLIQISAIIFTICIY